MAYNDNTMLPVPMWSSTDYWYDKKTTYHKAFCHPVVQLGRTLPIVLTMDNGFTSGESISNVTVTASGTAANYNWAGKYSGTLTPAGTLTLTRSSNPRHKIVITQNPTYGYYTISCVGAAGYTSPGTMYLQGTTQRQFTHDEIEAGMTLEATVNNLTYTITLPSIDMEYNLNLPRYLHLYSCDGTHLSTKSVTMRCYAVPYNYQNSKRYVYAYIAPQTFTGTFTSGVYYYALSVYSSETGTKELYSEPFFWLDSTSTSDAASLADYVHVTYRRSEPIVTTDNYMPFTIDGTDISFHMYIHSTVMMPPFHFDVDVVEIDGRKFPEKQVSYRVDRCEFVCTAYFVEAIRLLWHCDIRNVEQGVYNKRVDYMEPPEVDWSDDNHLCNVVLEFQSNTVMQTNGLASAYADSSDYDHTAYDNSFDESFD